MGGNDSDEPDIKVITYRNNYHSHQQGDPNASVEDNSLSPKDMTAWQRLLQFIFIFFVIHYFLWPFFVSFILYFLSKIGLFWLAVILVCVYIPKFLDNAHLKHGRPWFWFRTLPIWRYAHLYGRLEVVRLEKLDPAKQYIFGIYPHGILILSRIASYGGLFEKLFPEIDCRVLGATPMFWIPFARDLCLWLGAVDARRSCAEHQLNYRSKEGKPLSLLVYPGGSSEIFFTNPKSKQTILVIRKGFIRLALQHGASLVPTFVFGEKWMYSRWMIPDFIRSFFMRVLKTPLIVFWGRYFSWMPFHGKGVTVVYGHHINVPGKIDSPTDEQVEQYYHKYIEEMKMIWQTYKSKFGYDDDEELVLIDAKEADPFVTKGKPLKHHKIL